MLLPLSLSILFLRIPSCAADISTLTIPPFGVRPPPSTGPLDTPDTTKKMLSPECLCDTLRLTARRLHRQVRHLVPQRTVRANPKDYSCGCGGNSSYYPTAALSSAAYGSSISSGPGCGQCFNVSLVSAFIATPPFVILPADQPWVVVKIT